MRTPEGNTRRRDTDLHLQWVSGENYGLLREAIKDRVRVRAQYTSNFDKFDDIDTSFTSLNASDKRMRSLKLLCKISLRKSGALSCRHQKFDQDLISPTSQRFSEGVGCHGALLSK